MTFLTVDFMKLFLGNDRKVSSKILKLKFPLTRTKKTQSHRHLTTDNYHTDYEFWPRRSIIIY